MSDFVREQLLRIGIRMNGGLPRFQAQSLKKLRIPDIDSLNAEIRSALIRAYNNKDMALINHEINKYCTLHAVVNSNLAKSA